MSPIRRSLIATMLLVVCVVLLLQQHALIARRPVGIALQLVAIALMIWARATFGMRSFHATANPTAGGLVDTGPYRYWRHPIYAAVLIFVWGGVLGRGVAPTPIELGFAAAATLLTFVRVQAEEQLLRVAMPEYAAYAARTKRFIPFVL
jgi:protein-S-isoprenylcysteine O-methyltransferase Ste14